VLVWVMAMHTFRKRHRARLRRSERLRFRLTRLVLGAIQLFLLAAVIAYLVVWRG